VKPLRLFVALNTPREIRALMSETCGSLAAAGPDVRWEPDGKLHCTLKFLGDTDPSRLDAIVRSLESAASSIPPLVIRYAGLGTFPHQRDPKVLWIGIECPGGTLASLQRNVEEHLSAVGCKPEDRPFHPHVTIGRVKSRKGLGNLLRTMESITFTSEPVTVNQIELVRSDLKPAGSVYTNLKSIPLKG